jgi:hypothetical protein
MPWCPACERFLSPPTVRADGTCPSCGRPVEAAREHPPGGGKPAEDEELPPVPAHLKILGGALAVYLGYRFVQGVEWVIHRF